jgi:hypothetical protein
LQLRFDFNGLRHELVTQEMEGLGHFLSEAWDFGTTSNRFSDRHVSTGL